MPAVFPYFIRNKGKALYSELDILHIESIPSDPKKRDDNHKKIIQKAYKTYKLNAAIVLESGIPYKPQTADFEKYKPIVLEVSTDPKNSRAVYTQLFKECSIYAFSLLEEKRIACTVKKQSESGGAWGYSFDVKLCYQHTDYQKLNAHEQEVIKKRFNISSDRQAANMFEISTLAVDLNTLSVKSVPVIEGLPEKTIPEIITAIMDYIKLTQENAMKLCHTIKPAETNNFDYLFKPTNYTFTVSGHSSNNPELYTLNYLTTFDGNPPLVKAIEWDWLTEAEAKQGVGGIMAINRSYFFEAFNSVFKDRVLYGLRKQVDASMESQTCSFSYCYSYSQDTSADTSNFTYDNNQKLYVWGGYSHYSESETATCWISPFFAATGKLKFNYTVSCTARAGSTIAGLVTYPAIVYDINVILWADVIYDDDHSEGNIFNRTITAAIGYAVDQYGAISLKKNIRVRDNGTTMNQSGWSQFASFGGIDKCVDEISGKCGEWVSESIDQIQNEFMRNFLCYSNWVMPGNKTSVFRNERFSSDLDFCNEIIYASQ